MFTAPLCIDAEEESWFLRVAALQYAILRTTNAIRHQGSLTEPEVMRALRQALVEGIRGDSLARKIRKVFVATHRQ